MSQLQRHHSAGYNSLHLTESDGSVEIDIIGKERDFTAWGNVVDYVDEKNNKGPRMEPWSTQEMTGREDYCSPPMTTTCEWQVK